MKHFTKSIWLALVALVMVYGSARIAVAAGSSNLLANPSFESGDAAWNPSIAGSTSASGFPISTPPDGTRFMLLIGYPGGGIPAISQDAGVVVPGATYNLSFYAAARTDSRQSNIGRYPGLSALQFTASIVLRNGSVDTQIASTFVNPDLYAPGSWVQTTLSGAVPANATGSIVVEFIGNGFRGNDNQQTGIDMVVLAGPPPPPVNQPPVADAGPDQTVYVGDTVILDGRHSSDPDGDALSYYWRAVTAPGLADNGDGTASFTPFAPGEYIFALVVDDGQGGTASDEVMVRVPNRPPVASAGDDQTVNVGDSVTLDGSASYDFDAFKGSFLLYTWTQTGGPQPVKFQARLVKKGFGSPASVSFSVFEAGVYTFSLVVNDGELDSESDEVAVTVISPNQPPVADAGPDQTVECAGASTGVTLDGTASSDPDGDALSYSWSENGIQIASRATASVSLPHGDHTITLQVTDPAGASNTEDMAVSIVDTTPPVVTAPADITTEASRLKTLVVIGTATAEDAVGVVSLVSDAPEPAEFPVGTTIVTWTARDAAGNTGTAQQTITITDHTAPVVDTPAAVTAEATSPQGAAVVLTPPQATDNVGVVSLISNAPATFPLGTTTVTWTATDAAGNTGTATQLVTVKDTTPPVVTAPVAITLEATGPLTTVAMGMATATDAVGVTSLSSNAPTSFPLGTTTVIWTAKDAAGNTGTAAQLVNIKDSTAPRVTAALTAISRDHDEDEDEDGNFYRITATATDLVDPRPVVTAQITQPLTSSTSMTVSYKREKKNHIQIQTEKKKLVVKLEGPSEQALRSLWAQVLSSGGFTVSDGQQVQLVLKKDKKDKKDEYEAKYRFDGNLKLISAKGPGLSLVVSARDAAGNQSPPAVVVPGKSGAAKVVSDGSLPTSFSLEPNYPNPFNPATTLRYNLVEAGLVQLTVYNVMGQQVRVLVDQVQETGGYQVEWDATNAAGQRVAPGLYLYRLVAGDQAAVGKMLLVK